MEIQKEASTQYDDFKGTLACEDYDAIGAMSMRANVPEGQFPIGFRASMESGDVHVSVLTMKASSIDDARRQLLNSERSQAYAYDATFKREEFLKLFRRFSIVGWNRAVHDVVISSTIDENDGS